MSSFAKVQNRLHRIKVEIMNLEEAVQSAEAAGKPHFANRLRMMIKKKVENITSLVEED